MSSNRVVVRQEDLFRMTSEVFQALGAPEDEADIIADTLVDADLRGVHSHGTMRLNVYPQRITGGAVSPKVETKLVKDGPSFALMDGGNGMGQVVSYRAMNETIKKAKASGVGLIGVKHSNHFGAAAYFANMALEADVIGLVFTVSSVNVMAAWGSVDKLLGNNPLAIGAPAGEELPLLLDMAMSVAAVGKIKLASYSGDNIPEGWALNKYGEPTIDAHEALEGLAAPLAGYKGSGLAVMVGAIAGLLTGGAIGSEVKDIFYNLGEPQNTGHTFMAIDIAHFVELKEYKKRADTFIRELKNSKKARGTDVVLMPGEREFLLKAQRKKEGIPLNAEVVRQISRVAVQFGVKPVHVE
ncbi:MAG TPA: Ldh family oxidoreductase [Bacillales bacterium]|nr:Ldh family oxidoreductase [Bacillales bacterium]